MSKVLKGIGASRGIAIAKAYRMVEPDLSFEKKEVTQCEKEVARFKKALHSAEKELLELKDHAKKNVGEEEASIIDAHLCLVNDPELISMVMDRIRKKRVNAEYALSETINFHLSMFGTIENEYMNERVADIQDVSKRILSHLLNVHRLNPKLITEEVIIVSADLSPSEAVQLNKSFVKGFISDIGGRTSHTAIIAKSLEIPAVVGTKQAMNEILTGDLVILDGINGKVHINPTREIIENYKKMSLQYEADKKEWFQLVNETTLTQDGRLIKIGANINTPKDVHTVLSNGGEAIGLFRTEFLYMGRKELPSEEEQFEAYKEVLIKMDEKPVIIRTLDIGGDKGLSYLQFPSEINPFLGFRAIRICLQEQMIFRTQLRALLRASAYGNLKIMFPMIATLTEFQEAKNILEEEKDKLKLAGIHFSEKIEIGMMIETPSSALMADHFAKEADFFSIGTNDLIQFTMAADRMNEKVEYLYQPYHPAILRFIKMIVDAAKKEGIWVGMCGEMAEDERMIPILIGLGVQGISMNVHSILRARSLIKKLNRVEMQALSERLLNLTTGEKVIEELEQSIKIN
ncbi:phosphotransferase system enzyme I (PtsI) [Oikeobacillus pervagus]|uniref:Phosphoenolpyruvate-protein phosphotransferase n=1 Tax=Oikeobacillus pervagus TaxID=1325931 RepID=A0AAJ1WIW4_9BACI|nr:phosphoenolpyruvate--protein phosphotransferase [Oikeobacillus pervagus]MDQ0214833.1 phosphotransferase system enzyme I (PtsI) [Oikeobacillus pervagus]